MKKFGIIVLTLSLLVIGMVMVDPGIPKVNEVQGSPHPPRLSPPGISTPPAVLI
jgi:hypothetical protein